MKSDAIPRGKCKITQVIRTVALAKCSLRGAHCAAVTITTHVVYKCSSNILSRAEGATRKIWPRDEISGEIPAIKWRCSLLARNAAECYELCLS